MKQVVASFAVAVSLLLAGCGGPRFQGSYEGEVTRTPTGGTGQSVKELWNVGPQGEGNGPDLRYGISRNRGDEAIGLSAVHHDENALDVALDDTAVFDGKTWWLSGASVVENANGGLDVSFTWKAQDGTPAYTETGTLSRK